MNSNIYYIYNTIYGDVWFVILISRTLFVNISFLFSFFSTETSQNKIHVKKIYFGCVTWFLVVCYMGGIYHNRPDIDLLDPADILTDPGLEFTSWRGSCRRVCPPSQRNFDPLDSSCTSEIEMIDYKRQK